jgi:hypothetical protein
MYHESKEHLQNFLSSPVGSVQRVSSLDSLLCGFPELERTESEMAGKFDGKVKLEKSGSSVHRIDYYVSVMRLGFALENAVRHFDKVPILFNFISAEKFWINFCSEV